MAIPTPEEMQKILNIHPDQVAARQALLDAAGGNAQALDGSTQTDQAPPPDHMPTQPVKPAPVQVSPQPTAQASSTALIPRSGPRALNVPSVGAQAEEERPAPLPVRISSPKLEVPPVGSPGPVPGSVVAGVDSRGRPTLAPDQQHQLPPDGSPPPPLDAVAPGARALNVAPVGAKAPEESSIHDLMTKPIAVASSEGTAPTNPYRNPADASRYARDRAILDYDTTNGSGVDRFRQRHHVWGGLLKALNVAGSILAPGPMSMVPGTDLNHQVKLGQDRARVKNDLQDEATQANTAHLQAETENMVNPPGKATATQLEFDKAGNLLGFRDQKGNLLGPHNPALTQDMKDMLDAAEGRASSAGSPDSQAMAFMVKNGMTPTDAYKKLQEMKSDNKPDTAAQNKQQFQAVIGKLAAENGNKLQDGMLTSPQKTADAISNARTLTPQEKQFALSFIAANSTPANVIYAGAERGASYGATRQYPVLDTKNGNRPIYVSADELNRAQTQEPGRYLASGPGTTALNKENLMEDIRGGIQQVRDALNNPNMPEFTARQKVKIAIAMRERDPRSAVSSLITAGDLGTVTPEQEDYLIAHSILAEQAMAMRTVLGAGQGSQDLRAAITNTFPGPTTPSKRYGLKQLDAFEKTIDRLERGIPNVPLKDQRNGGSNNNSLAGPIQQGEPTASGPGGHTIVFRSNKWVDPANGVEVK